MSRIRIKLGVAYYVWAIIHLVAGFIAIPVIDDKIVKLLIHEGNIESFKYCAINPKETLVAVPLMRAVSLESPPITVRASY